MDEVKVLCLSMPCLWEQCTSAQSTKAFLDDWTTLKPSHRPVMSVRSYIEGSYYIIDSLSQSILVTVLDLYMSLKKHDRSAHHKTVKQHTAMRL